MALLVPELGKTFQGLCIFEFRMDGFSFVCATLGSGNSTLCDTQPNFDGCVQLQPSLSQTLGNFFRLLLLGA